MEDFLRKSCSGNQMEKERNVVQNSIEESRQRGCSTIWTREG